MSLNTVLAGGLIVDGTGSRAYRADVGLEAGRVAALGDLSAATTATRIDVSGRVVCPGFIDMHAHSDLTLLVIHESTLTEAASFGLHGRTRDDALGWMRAQATRAGLEGSRLRSGAERRSLARCACARRSSRWCLANRYRSWGSTLLGPR